MPNAFEDKELAAAAGRKGRKRGPNKHTVEQRKRIRKLLDVLYDDIMANLDELSLQEKARLYKDLMEFDIPKQHRIQNVTEPSEILPIKFITMSADAVEKIRNHEQE